MLQEHLLNAQYSRSMSKYAPGAVYVQIVFLEHIELRILPQIIHAPRAADPGQLFMEHNFRPKSHRSLIVKKVCRVHIISVV